MDHRSCLVLGGAHCVWRDLRQAREIGHFDATVAVNDAVAHYPGQVDIVATLHPEKLARWISDRRSSGYPEPGMIVAHKGNAQTGRRNAYPVDGVIDYRWPGSSGSGSSGLFAIKVAMEQGFDRIVLCGVPMTATRHFFDQRQWRAADMFWKDWKQAMPSIKDKVRSMSGRTRKLLGAPTASWLTEITHGD